MEPLDLAIQLSDLFEATDSEGGTVAQLIDHDIIPYMALHLKEGDGIGLGARFSKILDRVQTIIGQGGDEVRSLKQMMKNVLTDYINRTKDPVTGRSIFHNAIMQGKDAMLTVTSAGLLANALAGQHPREAMKMMQQVGMRLTGSRPVSETSSGAAVSAGAIADAPKSKIRRRKESIFAEWADLLETPANIGILQEIALGSENRHVNGVLVDPTTAELVVATHIALSPDRQRRFEAKEVGEMIRIAHRLFEKGAIQLIVDEN